VHFHHVRIDASQASGLALDNRYDAHAHGVVEVLK
jgi:hypothetical protein